MGIDGRGIQYYLPAIGETRLSDAASARLPAVHGPLKSPMKMFHQGLGHT